MGLQSHKIKLTLSLYICLFPNKENTLYGGTSIQTKTKEHVAERLKKHSFEMQFFFYFYFAGPQ